MAFTPDGKYLLTIDQTGIKFFNGKTFKCERSISYGWSGYIAFSPDESILAFAAEFCISIVDIQKGEVLAKLSRPNEYWIGPRQSDHHYYWNGKVTFSADGKYIIVKYQNSLARWDWQNEPTKPEIFTTNFGDSKIIGFSPDKKYLVQQSNYQWDMAEKKVLKIEGLLNFTSGNSQSIAATENGSCIAVISQENQSPSFINVFSKRLYTTTPQKYTAYFMALSQDSSLFASGIGGAVLVWRLSWGTTHVLEEKSTDKLPELKVLPQPAKSAVKIIVINSMEIPAAEIKINDMQGAIVRSIYSGSFGVGEHSFTCPVYPLAIV